MTDVPTSLTLEQALEQAVANHRVGNLQDAERLYRAILQVHPWHPDANHNLGALAMTANQVSAALPLFKTALETNPLQVQYWLSYIDAMIKTGQYDEARQLLLTAREKGLPETELGRLLSTLPTQPATFLCPIAITQREAGDYKKAAAALHAWLAEHPDDAEAWGHLAHTFLLDQQEGPARSAIDRALAIAPNHPVTQRNQARLLLKRQQPEAALQAAQAAYRDDPQNLESGLVLAATLTALGRTEQASQLLEHAIATRPDYAEAFASRAMLKLRDNDPAGALTDAEKALRTKPHLVQLWSLISALRLQMGDRDGAMTALAKSLQSDPHNASHLANLGELKRQAGMLEDAIQLLQQAVNVAPTYLLAKQNLGVALREAKRLDEAKFIYESILKVAPDNLDTKTHLAVVLKDLGLHHEALDLFLELLEIQGNNAEILADVGALQYQLRLYAEAESSLKRAIGINSKLAEAYNTLANVLRERGDMNEARALSEKALSINPSLPSAHHTLGNLLKEMGCIEKAEKQFELAYALNPDGFSGLDSAIKNSVLAYLQNNHHRSLEMLNLGNQIQEQKAKKFKPTQIYHKYLKSLISWHNLEKNPRNSENINPLFVIGESHSLSAHNIEISIGPQNLLCKSFWVEGCKQWHLGAKEANKYKWQLERIMKSIPKSSHVLFIIGEIDCRWDGEIMNTIKKTPNQDHLEKIVSATINNYLDYLNILKHEFDHKLIVSGVPASNINITQESQDIAPFLNVISTFNKILKTGATERGMGFLDVYSLTNRGDGFSNKFWHLDSHHLKPNALKEAFKKHHQIQP